MRIAQRKQLNKLWLARKKAGLGQKSVARLLGYKSISPISEYEAGKLLPSLATAFKLAIIYRTPLPELYAALYTQMHEEISSRHTTVAAACPAKDSAPSYGKD